MKKRIEDHKIAIIAGAFRLPFLVVKDLRAQGYNVFIIGIKNFCDPAIKPDLWTRLGSIGTTIKELKKRKIKKVVMVGTLGHPNLSDLRPDFTTIKILARLAMNQKGHNSMLTTLMNDFEKFGFKILAAQQLCPNITFKKGLQTKFKPSKTDLADIIRGKAVSKVIGKLDIGMATVVHKQVLAVEAAEGTEEMLNRVIIMRKKSKKSGGVLVKMLKPGQDLRADIPAIGTRTIIAVSEAKLNGIVVNSKNCWIIDKDEVIKLANKNKIFILAE